MFQALSSVCRFLHWFGTWYIGEKREEARQLRRRQKPYMLIGSPGCKAFSTLHALTRSKGQGQDGYDRARRRVVKHIEFMVEMYREQMAECDFFIHGHPRQATSWQLRAMGRPV